MSKEESCLEAEWKVRRRVSLSPNLSIKSICLIKELIFWMLLIISA